MDDRTIKIKNIDINIENCILEDRKKIFDIINSKVSRENIHEEGTGVRIKYKFLSYELLCEIDIFIINAIKKNNICLEIDSEEE